MKPHHPNSDESPERGEFEEVETAVHLALLSAASDDMPEQLRQRLHRDARIFFSGLEGSKPRPSSATRWMLPAMVGAAAALLLVFTIKGRRVPTAAEIYSEMSSFDEVALRIPWSDTGDPLSSGIEGEVLWNNEEQRGFMRFEGLAANDPRQQQYQLWIFDRTRPEATPVDGGVFDIQGSGETLVPIRAKIRVGDPFQFAVTLEKPGGVVVSERERIVAAAVVESAGD